MRNAASRRGGTHKVSALMMQACRAIYVQWCG